MWASKPETDLFSREGAEIVYLGRTAVKKAQEIADTSGPDWERERAFGDVEQQLIWQMIWNAIKWRNRYMLETHNRTNEIQVNAERIAEHLKPTLQTNGLLVRLPPVSGH